MQCFLFHWKILLWWVKDVFCALTRPIFITVILIIRLVLYILALFWHRRRWLLLRSPLHTFDHTFQIGCRIALISVPFNSILIVIFPETRRNSLHLGDSLYWQPIVSCLAVHFLFIRLLQGHFLERLRVAPMGLGKWACARLLMWWSDWVWRFMRS